MGGNIQISQLLKNVSARRVNAIVFVSLFSSYFATLGLEVDQDDEDDMIVDL